MIGPFLPYHPPIGLVNSVAGPCEVPDRFTQMTCEILLPSLGVADLVALSEAVAVGVDPAFPTGVNE